MKKKIIITFVLCLLLVGCGKKKIENKTLACSKNYTVSENEVIEKITSYYTEDILTSTKYEIKMNIAEKYLNYKDMLESKLKEKYSEYENVEGITYNLINGENHITIVIDIMYDKLTENTNIKEINNDKSTYNDAFETLTKNGYICS